MEGCAKSRISGFRFRTYLGTVLGAILEAFPTPKSLQNRPPEGSWGVLGASWGLLGSLGGVLGASWGLLGRTWGGLAVTWGGLAGSWGLLGASWSRLGGVLGASWERAALKSNKTVGVLKNTRKLMLFGLPLSGFRHAKLARRRPKMRPRRPKTDSRRPRTRPG